VVRPGHPQGASFDYVRHGTARCSPHLSWPPARWPTPAPTASPTGVPRASSLAVRRCRIPAIAVRTGRQVSRGTVVLAERRDDRTSARSRW